jgi:hypothetical protein
MPETMVLIGEDPEIAEQKLWRAVIANVVRDWFNGQPCERREAQQYLFHDEDDFAIVCFSAGMDPRYVRERLKRIRDWEGAQGHPRASRN